LFLAEHDPSTHSELAHHLRRTISGIAIENGYAEEDIESNGNHMVVSLP
jgi:hypothetical protein